MIVLRQKLQLGALRSYCIELKVTGRCSNAREWKLAGIIGIFGDRGAAVVDVVDCGFSPELQVGHLDRLIVQGLDAIISLPVANEQVAAAHARVCAAGIKLILLDTAPTGLFP